MSLLKGLKKDIAAPTTEKDTLGGVQLLDSNVYGATITMAYGQKSTGGALGIFLTFKTDEGKEINQTIYVTGGDAKGNSPTYKDKDGNEHYLPGYLQVNGLCLLTVGKELSDIEDEEKTISVWDSTAKAKVLKKMPVMTELIGQRIKIGVLRQTESKQEKNEANVYVPTTDTREVNEINKFFRDEDSLTVAEIEAQATEPKFMADWLEKFKGKTLDKTSKDAKAPSGKPAPAAGGAASAPKPASSLFGKKA